MSAFADPNVFHLDEGTIITRHGTSGTRRDMRRDDTANVNTVINPPHCRRGRSRGREIKAYPGHNNYPGSHVPHGEILHSKGRKAARRRSHGCRRNAVLSGKFEMNGYLIGVGGFHGKNKGMRLRRVKSRAEGPFCSSISDGGL